MDSGSGAFQTLQFSKIIRQFQIFVLAQLFEKFIFSNQSVTTIQIYIHFAKY